MKVPSGRPYFRFWSFKVCKVIPGQVSVLIQGAAPLSFAFTSISENAVSCLQMAPCRETCVAKAFDRFSVGRFAAKAFARFSVWFKIRTFFGC